MIKKPRTEQFIDKVSEAFLRVFGEEEPVKFIIYVNDETGDDSYAGINGKGCPLCVIEELTVFVAMNGIKHVGDDDDEGTGNNGKIPPNQRN